MVENKTAKASNVHILDTIDNALHDKTKPWNPLFHWAEERIGCNRLKLFFGTLCALTMYLASGRGTMLLGDLIGFVYPAYATVSLTAIRGTTGNVVQQPSGHSVNDTIKWLTYWLMFAAVLIVEQPFNALLRLVPFYCLIKTVFFAYCSLSIETNGSALVYAVIVRRYFAKYRSDHFFGNDE